MQIGVDRQFPNRPSKWMTFVDGENLAIRAKSLAANRGLHLLGGDHYEEDVFVWIPGQSATQVNVVLTRTQNMIDAARATYYASVRGDHPKVADIRERLWNLGFNPAVFKRTAEGKSKGVDVALTKDLLSHAFQGNYDGAVLIAGDGDYVPLIEEVKRLGKIVCVAFFAGEGLSPELRLVSDLFADLTDQFVRGWESLAGKPAM